MNSCTDAGAVTSVTDIEIYIDIDLSSPTPLDLEGLNSNV